MTDSFNELSKECRNRICIWFESLSNAYSYLMVENHIKDKLPSNIYCKYSINGMDAGSNVNLTARSALIESTVILFCQIYNQGNKCNGIAQNRGNSEVDGFRKFLEDIIVQKLDWSNDKYSSFLKNICDMRNQLFAHYDASKSEYRVIRQGISSRKMVGCNLNEKTIKDLTSIIEIMLEYILEQFK
jgi:hypothetical protein